jgi:hypothetical protein
MADSVISQLPIALTVSGVDLVPIDQGGVTKRTTIAQLGNGTVITAPGKILSVNNSLTLNGTDGTTMTFPVTSATIARTDSAQTFTGMQTFGAITCTTINGETITPSGGTFSLATGKTFTVNNTITLTGTDGATITLPTTSATMARTDSAQTFTGVQTFSSTIVGNINTANTLFTARTIDGVSFNGSGNILVVAPATHASPSKTILVDADELTGTDSASAFILSRFTWANIKATLWNTLATLTLQGDQVKVSNDPSILREGTCSAASGDLYTLLGATATALGMKFRTHGFPISAAGVFGLADETGGLTIWVQTEGSQERYYYYAGGTIGVAPTPANFTLQGTFDYTTGILSLTGGVAGVNASASPGLPIIDCTQATGALTFSSSSSYLAFRNVSLTNGTPTVVASPPANLVLPSGGTLGVVTTLSGRIILAEMNNAGVRELAICNIAGGLQVDEENLISTTAISASATANNVWYSTTSRSNLAYKIIGAFDVVNTAGAWSSPTTKINAGGNALTAMSSLGYGQTWQVLTGSRVSGTTYYNTTGKPIQICVGITTSNNANVVINGVTIHPATANNTICPTFIVPTANSYSVTVTISFFVWSELR